MRISNLSINKSRLLWVSILGFFLFFPSDDARALASIPTTCKNIPGQSSDVQIGHYFAFINQPITLQEREQFLNTDGADIPPIKYVDSFDCIYKANTSGYITFADLLSSHLIPMDWQQNHPNFLTNYYWPELRTGKYGVNDPDHQFELLLSTYFNIKPPVAPAAGVNDAIKARIFYTIRDGNQEKGYLFFLGDTEHQVAISLGTWSGKVITISKGEKKTFKVELTTDVTGVKITCENCADQAIIISPSSENTPNVVLLTLDETKIKTPLIILKAQKGAFVDQYSLTVNIVDVECSALSEGECATNSFCFSFEKECIAKTRNIECVKVPKALCGTKEGSSYCTYLEATNTCTDYLSSAYQSSYKPPNAGDYKGPLPPCAFDGSCRNVNDLIQLFINFGKMTLGIVGSAALIFFVYGGFMMIISAGNAERVKKGRDILVAAIVGIVIAFSAYALINFVLDALNVSEDFRVIEEIK